MNRFSSKAWSLAVGFILSSSAMGQMQFLTLPSGANFGAIFPCTAQGATVSSAAGTVNALRCAAQTTTGICDFIIAEEALDVDEFKRTGFALIEEIHRKYAEQMDRGYVSRIHRIADRGGLGKTLEYELTRSQEGHNVSVKGVWFIADNSTLRATSSCVPEGAMARERDMFANSLSVARFSSAPASKAEDPVPRQSTELSADAVRTALSAAAANQAPPIPEFDDTDARLKYLRWFGGTSDRLKDRKPDWNDRREFLQTVWYEAKRAGLDIGVVLAVVEVSSNFRKLHVSADGARGYMGVKPKWSAKLGDGDETKLFHSQTNLRFGCVILRHYLDSERGNLRAALGRYNGPRNQRAFQNAVMAARTRWEAASN